MHGAGGDGASGGDCDGDCQNAVPCDLFRYTLDQALAHPWVVGTAASDAPIDTNVVKSMFNFTAKNKFKKEALKLIARSDPGFEGMVTAISLSVVMCAEG